MNARQLALQALLRARRSETHVQDEMHALMAEGDATPADRALAMEIAMGTTRHRRTVDYLLQSLLTRPIHTMSPPGRLVLETAAYQLLLLDRVPDYAVVNEAVALMRQHARKPLAGLANAVLRKFAALVDRSTPAEQVADPRRRIPSPHGQAVVLREPLLPEDDMARLGVAMSFPDVVVRRWVALWGRAQALEVMEALNRPPHVFARVNRLRAGAEDVLAALPEAARETCRAVRHNVLDLTSLPREELLRLLDRGLITVEDPTAMAAVEALDVEPGQDVLDLCAAPGGKASYIAELLAGQGTLTAADRPGPRVELLRRTVERLGLANVRVVTNEPQHALPRAFDRVLVDVPCSNTGVLNRRAEARWHFSREALQSLTAVQWALLTQAAAATRVGGLCVYSTCSLEPEENSELVQRFLAEHPFMVLQVERETLPSAEGDGAYYARMVRVAEA